LFFSLGGFIYSFFFVFLLREGGVLKMKKNNPVDLIALILVIVGAINWGLVGIMNFNLVDALLGVDVLGTAWVAKIVYILVGIAGLWMIYLATNKK
jgi:uncharacterized protein